MILLNRRVKNLNQKAAQMSFWTDKLRLSDEQIKQKKEQLNPTKTLYKTDKIKKEITRKAVRKHKQIFKWNNETTAKKLTLFIET